VIQEMSLSVREIVIIINVGQFRRIRNIYVVTVCVTNSGGRIKLN